MPRLDLNQDKLIQSQLCYHYTKRQGRGGIIGASPRERKRNLAAGGAARIRGGRAGRGRP